MPETIIIWPMGDDLKLNGLPRYRKWSRRLLLETHSSCEVPAGCGGAVLRWRDPREGFAAEASLYAMSEVWQLLLDGEPPPSGRMILPYGPRVLALRIRGMPRRGAVMFALSSSPRHRTGAGAIVEPEPALLTQPDRWRYTTEPPDDERWLFDPGFDDSGWLPMQRTPPIPPREDGRLPWAVRRMRKLGAQPIGFGDPHPDDAWVRCVFTLEQP